MWIILGFQWLHNSTVGYPWFPVVSYRWFPVLSLENLNVAGGPEVEFPVAHVAYQHMSQISS